MSESPACLCLTSALLIPRVSFHTSPFFVCSLFDEVATVEVGSEIPQFCFQFSQQAERKRIS